jgi:hypothetical protein
MHTVTCTVEGVDHLVGTHYWPEVVTNGAFVITDYGFKPKEVGDRWNESTDWTFDFGSQPTSSWRRLASVDHASLCLHLVTGRGDVLNDYFSLKHYATFTNLLSGVPLNTNVVVTLDLLDQCTGEQILKDLQGAPEGQISIRYDDDALIYKAEITLSGKRAKDQ